MSTSVILIVLATMLMAVALALGDSVAVLSNGILLGGLFTMLYGVGWGLASGNSVTRFLVLVAALAVSLVLGYLKFVRGRRPVADGEPAPGRGGRPRRVTPRRRRRPVGGGGRAQRAGSRPWSAGWRPRRQACGGAAGAGDRPDRWRATGRDAS